MDRKQNITLFYNIGFQFLSKFLFKEEFPDKDIISEAY